MNDKMIDKMNEDKQADIKTAIDKEDSNTKLIKKLVELNNRLSKDLDIILTALKNDI